MYPCPPHASPTDRLRLVSESARAFQRAAASFDLPIEEKEDCYLSFVCHVLTSQWAHRDYDFSSPASLRAFLLRCARNHLIDRCRSGRRAQRRCFPLEALAETAEASPPDRSSLLCSPECTALRRESTRLLYLALATLPPFWQICLHRHYLEGHSLASIAEATGRSPNAIKQILKRARAEVRKTLQRDGWTANDLL